MRGKKYLDKEEGERGKEVKGADKMERKTKNKKNVSGNLSSSTNIKRRTP